MTKKFLTNYLFCLAVGGVYLYGIHRTILSTTLIQVDSLSLYTLGLACIVIFMLILFNRYTVLVSGVIALLLGLLVFFTYEDVAEQYPLLYETAQMVFGRLPYRPELGRIVLWVIGLLTGFATVVFMVNHFSFYALFAGGAAVIVFTWLPGFATDERAFLILLASLCVMLVRKTIGSAGMALAAMPLALAVILFANARIPQDSAFFTPRDFHGVSTQHFASVRDFLYETFTPMHFSFSRTGFAGAGGRLGGPISPDNRFVMEVLAPGRTYLTGAISNTYTGDRWLPTLRDGDIYTHGLSPSRFEMLETSAALIRGATHADISSSILLARTGISHDESRRIPARHFMVVGIEQTTQHEIHTYRGHAPGIEYPLIVRIFDDIHRHRHHSVFAEGDETFFARPYISDEEWEAWAERQRRVVDVASEFVYQSQAFGTFSRHFEHSETEIIESRDHIYWHTYLPFDTITVRPGAHRTGTIFTPPRASELRFAEMSANYAPYVQVTPEGSKQLPRFMSHGTGYHLQFLNVDARLSFVEHILRGANAGVYAAQGMASETEMPTFMGGLLEPELHGFTVSGTVRIVPQSVVLFDAPLTVEEFAEMVEFYSHPFTPDTPARMAEAYSHPVTPEIRGRSSNVTINQISDPEHFMYLLNSFSATVLAQYAREVREHFMYVPDTVPARVHDLTAEIVADFDNDFDRVTAIRDYLLQFPYTLQPAAVPRGVCFVDFFLFEGQEGYCTYFASAMAIMSRIAGVPSRYVEGFVLPPGEPGEPVAVTNRMAHAWAEVYLEGFGWHIMEATPTYAFLADLPPPGGDAFTFDTGAFDRVQDLMRDFAIPDANRPIFTPVQIAADEPPAPTQQNAALLFAALIALILTALPVARSAQLQIRSRRVEKLPPKARLIAYFHAVTEIISCYTSAPTPDETPLAYGKRYGKRFAFRSDSIFYRDLIAMYYKAKYSTVDITPEEADTMKDAYEDLQDLLRAKRSGPAWAYLKYFRGGFIPRSPNSVG